ncbi:MAG: hypothetical protein ACOC0Z_03160 [Halohasta sp.]
MGDDDTGIPQAELTGVIGPPDTAAMRLIREQFRRDEPLVESTDFDSVLHPRALRIEFSDGIGSADHCRLSVTWYRSGAYRFHHVDSEDVNWRFDRHPNPHSPVKHFHEPPAAASHTAVESCIEAEQPRVVARAVHKLWRRAYETGTHDLVNTAQNPP